MNQDLTPYDQAKHWVAQYESVDDVKEFGDKAKAIAEYARRSNDTELEDKALKARLRAKRRWGELYSQMDKPKGSDYGGTGYDSRKHQPSYDPPRTLKEMGVSKGESVENQRLSKIPEKQFEEALTGKIPEAPTASKAREKATETGRPVISRTGKVHLPNSTAGSEREHDLVERNKNTVTMTIINAFENIVELGLEPGEYISHISAHRDFQMKRLDVAHQKAMPWIEQFSKLWRNQNA